MPKENSRDTVRKVARIARLELTDEEESMFSADMEKVLDSFRIIQKVLLFRQFLSNNVINFND